MSHETHSPEAIAALLKAAVANHRAGETKEAAAQYNDLLARAPDHPEALYLSGYLAYQGGALDEALVKLERSLALRPGHMPTLEALGATASKAGKFERAAECFAVVVQHQQDATTYYRFGYALFRLGRYDEALDAFRKTLALSPQHGDALYMLATISRIQGKLAQAEPLYERAIAIQPNNTYALDEYGGVLYELDKIAAADPIIRRAIAAAPQRANPYTNLGRLYQTDRVRAEEALALHDKAISLAPDYGEAHNNRGVTLYTLDRLDESIASFRRAIALKPEMPESHTNLGHILMMNGNLAEGWTEYGWRSLCKDAPSKPRPFTQPRWQGEDLGDGKLLVWGEQGIGDEVLYGSMAADLAERGVNLVWECDPRLAEMVQRSYPAVTVVGRTTPPHPLTADENILAQISTTDLGQYLRASLAAFSKRHGYLRADAARTAGYRARLLQGGGKRRVIGISWNSKNPDFSALKSSQLKDWASLWQAAGPSTQFVDLQYGDTAAERAAALVDLAHLDDLDLYNDIDGVAALIGACDVVITVSNSTAHLAGATDIPMYVMVPGGTARLWYWGAGESGSPWYPKAKVFKQQSVHDWSAMIARIARQLAGPS